jgi:hypothetical protein
MRSKPVFQERDANMKKTRCTVGLRCLLYAGMVAVMVIVPAAMAAQQDEKANMDTTTANNPMVPAIDASPPGAFETASFGLG